MTPEGPNTVKALNALLDHSGGPDSLNQTLEAANEQSAQSEQGNGAPTTDNTEEDTENRQSSS